MGNPLATIRRIVLMLVGVTLPFEYSAISIGGYPLTPNKGVAAMLLAFVGLQWAVERRRAFVDPKRIWVLFFSGVIAISAVQSLFVGIPFAPILEVVLTWYSLILFYLMLVYTLTSRRDVDLLLAAFAIGLVAASFSGLAGYGFVAEGRYGERIGGEGGNPNLFAFNLLIGIALAASFYFTTQRSWLKPVLIASIALMTMGVMFTLSRTAYLALPCMAGLWAFRFRRLDLLKYAIPALALPVLAVAFAPERVVDRFQDLVSAGSVEELDPSARDRFLMLPGIFKAFGSNPVSGVGLSGYMNWASRNDEVVHAIHNAYLQVLAENGLLGFIPFMAIVILSWRQFTRGWRLARRFRHKRDQELTMLELRTVMLQIALLGAIVMGLAQPTNRHKGLWLLFVLGTVTVALIRERIYALEPELAREAQPWSPAFAGVHQPFPIPADPPGR